MMSVIRHVESGHAQLRYGHPGPPAIGDRGESSPEELCRRPQFLA